GSWISACRSSSEAALVNSQPSDARANSQGSGFWELEVGSASEDWVRRCLRQTCRGGRGLHALARDEALVVAEEVEVRPGITALTWLAMIQIGTQQLHVVHELVVERERHDVVRRLSIGSGRNRRKAKSWRCAERHSVARLNTGPSGIHERHVRHSLRETGL